MQEIVASESVDFSDGFLQSNHERMKLAERRRYRIGVVGG
jgi:hypothetical protein